jgi:hypothetical protein
MFDWERNWRASGIVAVLLLVVGFIVYGDQPKVGASPEELVSFFDGDRTRILIATIIFCIGFLNLLWFGAALSTDLRDAGKGGWAAAATASSTALAAMLFLRMAVRAALAFSIVGSGAERVASGLSEFAFVVSVIVSYPAAMFVMSGAFGLWRAGMISKAFFATGVAAVVLLVLGGTTFAADGFWAPDGAYALISQLVFLVWIVVLSGWLAMRSPSSPREERAAVPTA